MTRDHTQTRALGEALHAWFEAGEQISQRLEEVSEVMDITANLISTQEEKNIEGLQKLGDKLGVDVLTPAGQLVAALKLTLETIKEIQTKPRPRGPFADFAQATLISILRKMVGGWPGY